MAGSRPKLDQEAKVRKPQGRSAADTVPWPEPMLGDLIAGITNENHHDEIDFGPPIGKEVL
jgi:antitoxin MazE